MSLTPRRHCCMVCDLGIPGVSDIYPTKSSYISGGCLINQPTHAGHLWCHGHIPLLVVEILILPRLNYWRRLLEGFRTAGWSHLLYGLELFECDEARVWHLLHMVEQGSKLYPTTIPITEGWAVDSEMSPIHHMETLQDGVISPLCWISGYQIWPALRAHCQCSQYQSCWSLHSSSLSITLSYSHTIHSLLYQTYMVCIPIILLTDSSIQKGKELFTKCTN